MVFPLAWRSSGQSATSCSTAESEVVALSHGLRHFGLPVQDLVHEFLGERIPLECLVHKPAGNLCSQAGIQQEVEMLEPHASHRDWFTP